ncbi:MAG: AmmeMemoRadiSam system protein B [Terriglobales bacterium]
MSTVRHAAVAGRFYPAQPEVLMRDVQSYLAATGEKIEATGCVVPHAGYMYSGHVAGAVYARLALPERFIILCPNHTGMGKPLAIMSEGAWDTPLGEAAIDHELAMELRGAFHSLTEDAGAHRAEHALEVQLPFLQALRRKFTFVPIAVGVGSYEPLAALGEAIAQVLAAHGEKILIIASSDMNHYESDAVTRVKDSKAIEQILKLDPRGLFDVVVKEEISMCGYGPAVAMLTAARRLGAESAELIKYATSADVSGDRDAVVGYAGVIVH